MLFKIPDIPFIITIKGLAHIFYEGFHVGHQKRKKKKKAFDARLPLQAPLFKCLKLDFVGKKRHWHTHNLTYFPL